MSANANLQRKTVNLAANASQPVPIAGNIFLCSSATKPFNLSINGLSQQGWDQGYGFKLKPGEVFTELIFFNTTATPITINYYVGDETIFFYTTRNQTTVNVGYPTFNPPVNPAAKKQFPGTAGPGARRTIVIQWVNGTGINIYDASGNGMAYLPGPPNGNSVFQLDTSDLVQIDTTGGPASCIVTEVYYSS